MTEPLERGDAVWGTLLGAERLGKGDAKGLNEALSDEVTIDVTLTLPVDEDEDDAQEDAEGDTEPPIVGRAVELPDGVRHIDTVVLRVRVGEPLREDECVADAQADAERLDRGDGDTEGLSVALAD